MSSFLNTSLDTTTLESKGWFGTGFKFFSNDDAIEDEDTIIGEDEDDGSVSADEDSLKNLGKKKGMGQKKPGKYNPKEKAVKPSFVGEGKAKKTESQGAKEVSRLRRTTKQCAEVKKPEELDRSVGAKNNPSKLFKAAVPSNNVEAVQAPCRGDKYGSSRKEKPFEVAEILRSDSASELTLPLELQSSPFAFFGFSNEKYEEVTQPEIEKKRFFSALGNKATKPSSNPKNALERASVQQRIRAAERELNRDRMVSPPATKPRVFPPQPPTPVRLSATKGQAEVPESRDWDVGVHGKGRPESREKGNGRDQRDDYLEVGDTPSHPRDSREISPVESMGKDDATTDSRQSSRESSRRSSCSDVDIGAEDSVSSKYGKYQAVVKDLSRKELGLRSMHTAAAKNNRETSYESLQRPRSQCWENESPRNMSKILTVIAPTEVFQPKYALDQEPRSETPTRNTEPPQQQIHGLVSQLTLDGCEPQYPTSRGTPVARVLKSARIAREPVATDLPVARVHKSARIAREPVATDLSTRSKRRTPAQVQPGSLRL